MGNKEVGYKFVFLYALAARAKKVTVLSVNIHKLKVNNMLKACSREALFNNNRYLYWALNNVPSSVLNLICISDTMKCL